MRRNCRQATRPRLFGVTGAELEDGGAQRGRSPDRCACGILTGGERMQKLKLVRAYCFRHDDGQLVELIRTHVYDFDLRITLAGLESRRARDVKKLSPACVRSILVYMSTTQQGSPLTLYVVQHILQRIDYLFVWKRTDCLFPLCTHCLVSTKKSEIEGRFWRERGRDSWIATV